MKYNIACSAADYILIFTYQYYYIRYEILLSRVAKIFRNINTTGSIAIPRHELKNNKKASN